MRALRLFFVALIFFPALLSAQTDTVNFPPLRIGEWRQHLPWQRAVYVTQSNTHVYFATEWAMLELDKAERSPKFISRVEGLSDVGMQLIRYNAATETVVMAYTNSNIDLYRTTDGSVVNLPFIRKNINLIGDKKIYSVAFDGPYAYLACGFGLVKLDLERAEAVYTVFTNDAVRAAAVFQDNLYMGTEKGLYRIDIDDPNPADFNNWERVELGVAFPNKDQIGALQVWKDHLYIGAANYLLRYDGMSVPPVEAASSGDRDVYFLNAEGQGLVIGWKRGFDGYLEYIDPSGARDQIYWTCEASKPFYTIEDQSSSNTFWIADDSDQFRLFNRNTNSCERFSFNSPYNHRSSDIAVGPDNTVYVATPGPGSGLSAPYIKNGLYMYRTGQWSRIWGDSNPELQAQDANNDMWRVAPHPDGESFYVGSYVGGLIEMNSPGATAKIYNKNNSILQSAGSTGDALTAIGGLAFDEDKNLWISNYDAPSAPIAVLKADGQIRNFSGAPQNNLLQVAVDRNGYKWFVVAFNGGVLVYDSGADIDDPSDDRYRQITTANSALPTNTVSCIGVDREGDVWVGTQQGVVTFECGSSVFDPEICAGRRRIVNVDGFNGYLLETEDVRCIAVDGANRKWFGTTNGVFVQSPDGRTQEARFTNTNSPLFDNIITDIAIDDKTGEAWIGTERGVVSLRAEATIGGKINSRSVYAYPNPVYPNYNGPIAIYGLAQDANVKITDVAGNLVYEGKSLGGQAVWDARDYLGRRVASGVYLVFATSENNFDSPDAIIAKVMVLN